MPTSGHVFAESLTPPCRDADKAVRAGLVGPYERTWFVMGAEVVPVADFHAVGGVIGGIFATLFTIIFLGWKIFERFFPNRVAPHSSHDAELSLLTSKLVDAISKMSEMNATVTQLHGREIEMLARQTSILQELLTLARIHDVGQQEIRKSIERMEGT